MTLGDLERGRGAGCGHRRSVKSWVETDPPHPGWSGLPGPVLTGGHGRQQSGPRASLSQGPGASAERREGRAGNQEGNRDPRPRGGEGLGTVQTKARRAYTGLGGAAGGCGQR